MTLQISLNSNSSGEGFLIAPVKNRGIRVPLTITTSHALKAMVTVSPGAQRVKISKTNLTLKPGQTTTVAVQGLAQSDAT